MLTIEVELLHGTIRASAQDTPLTGLQDPGEWPPSPARVFSAFVAADGTGERCRVTDASELRYLETQAQPPMIYADPLSGVTTSPVGARFVVLNERSKGAVQTYPGRRSDEARPGTRRAPRHSYLAYVWPNASTDNHTLQALRLRAARIGYLGCADSPVRVRVSNQPPSESVPTTAWQPVATGRTLLPVPYDGFIDELDNAFQRFTDGAPVRRSWMRTALQPYADPAGLDAVHRVPGTGVWLRFDQPVPGRWVLLVTETLRRALLDLYQRKVLGGDGDLPRVLTGHGYTGRGFQHVHWLALPDVGHPHARGRIHGAAIWLPEGTSADVLAGVRTAAWHLRRLAKPGVFSVGVRPHGGESRPWAANPRRWQQGSTLFASVLPVVHERFARPRPSLEEVGRWCRHAGLPAPVALRQHRHARIPGAVSLHPREVFRAHDERRPYAHMELIFDDPVVGPVVVGRKRQFGLGLFAPIETDEASDE